MQLGYLVCIVLRVLCIILFFSEQFGEEVGNGLAIGIAHAVHTGIDALCNELMCEPVALAVASQYATCLPELDAIEEFPTGDSYFANEQLIEVVGG